MPCLVNGDLLQTVNGLLVRVGVDSGKDGGCWNAPANSKTRRFCYIPINRPEHFRKRMGTFYQDPKLGFLSALGKFGPELKLPKHFVKAHLDPDYRHLTYGDWRKRAGQIKKLRPGDFLVFYSSFADIAGNGGELIYAITGFYKIREIKAANSVSPSKWHRNAHTRVFPDNRNNHVVVFAVPGKSGRLEKFIPIGCLRRKRVGRSKRRSYYVRAEILKAWGETGDKDWYIQRSRTLPQFGNPVRFLRWWRRQKVRLLKRNN